MEDATLKYPVEVVEYCVVLPDIYIYEQWWTSFTAHEFVMLEIETLTGNIKK